LVMTLSSLVGGHQHSAFILYFYSEDGNNVYPPKHWYPPTRLHDVTTQTTTTATFTAVKISYLRMN
jgi:hypothetical protein